MNNFFGRHINNVVDAVAVVVIAGITFALGGDIRHWLFGFLIFRTFSNGYRADDYFNKYLDARYGRWTR